MLLSTGAHKRLGRARVTGRGPRQRYPKTFSLAGHLSIKLRILAERPQTECRASRRVYLRSE